MTQDELVSNYLAWAKALTEWRLDAVRTGVSLPEFTSILPGATRELEYNEFVAEVERRRSAFSDFGRNIRVITGPLVAENTLVVHYNMTVTHDGELGWMGGDEVLRPTGKVITFPSVELVMFNQRGLIVRHIVVSDRLHTFLAMNRLS
jgi:hypothetical protein